MKQYTAKTLHGLESVLADELKALGAVNVEPLKRAVSFEGNQELLYRANYSCRTALHFLQPVIAFDIQTQQDYYDAITAVAWEKLFAVDCKMAVDATVFNSLFNNSHYTSLRAKDAIVDRFRRMFNQRPYIDTIAPEIRIDIYLNNNHCIVSLDSSGQSLFKRGYRNYKGFAPLNEVLAAGMIQLSGWDKKKTLYDPMCGSGTILIEAAMLASNIPAQYYREEPFAFEFWNDFDPMLWKQVKAEENKKISDPECEIYGSDISAKSIENAKNNLTDAKLHKDVQLKQGDFLMMDAPEQAGIIISNPPYGERLQPKDIEEMYEEFGNVLKRNYENYEVWMISSNMDALKKIGLHASKKITLFNGQLECKFEKFELYSGSKKQKKQHSNENEENSF